jgi:hypothetical protein
VSSIGAPLAQLSELVFGILAFVVGADASITMRIVALWLAGENISFLHVVCLLEGCVVQELFAVSLRNPFPLSFPQQIFSRIICRDFL